MSHIPGVSRHARERMAERFGADLSRVEWLAMVLSILDGAACRLRAMPPNGSGEIYAVQVRGLALRVVWQPLGGVITTVLAEDMNATRYHTGKPGRIRPSLIEGGGYAGGKRRKIRTVWQH